MEFVFIVDPVHLLKAYKDTSVAMMRALQSRGGSLFVLDQTEIHWRDGATLGRVHPLTVADDHHDWHRLGEPLVRPLASFSTVLMRKDPPFDMEYVYSTYLLELAESEGARVINRPRAIRDYNEKMAIARFPEFTVPTLVTRDPELIAAFIDEHRDVILKPLDGMGGTSVFRVRSDDVNRNVIIETIGSLGTRSVMAQRFIPEIADGDKRIVLIDGEPAPFSLARIPKPGETRGNLAAGGRGVAQRTRSRDRRKRRAQACRGGVVCRRARRHRRLPHRGQCHQSDRLRGNHRSERFRRRGALCRCPADEDLTAVIFWR
jgi:glutathione synthase